MKIQLDPLDPKSVENAIKQIEQYKKWLVKKEDELLRRLEFLGATKVSMGYARAIYGQDKDIKVSTIIFGNTLVIQAQGKDVCFVEFGAGIRYGNGYLGNRPEGIVEIGEYGKGKGKNPKGWWYTGDDGSSHHSYGNPPAMVMYKTSLELAEAITEIAREVFKS